jgi:hypothetical protein
MNKFLEKADMDSNNFFLRWRNLDKPGQESQKIFPAKHPMNHDDIRQKVNSYLILKKKKLRFSFFLLDRRFWLESSNRC